MVHMPLWAVAGVCTISVFAIGACTPPRPTPVLATIDLNCGNRTFTVSTGNNSGSCTIVDKIANCGDGLGGNTAAAACESGCISSSGSGSCKLK